MNGLLEKPEVDNARKLRGYVFHRSGRWKSTRESFKKARIKLEMPICLGYALEKANEGAF